MTTLRFAAIGLDHDHIYGMCAALIRGGAELVAVHEPDAARAARFRERFPQARQVAEADAILDDPGIAVVAIAAANHRRAPLALAAMRRGKDALVDKPGVVDAGQLEEIERGVVETGRRFIVMFGERFEHRGTAKALALARDGAIGRVVHMTALAPHKLRAATRADWFFDPARHGGILNDIASHQFDQLLHVAGTLDCEILAAHVANRGYADRPGFQDVGECLVRAGGLTGYVRVDWFAPDGLPVFGDGRLVLVGTEATLELRRYVDLAGAPGGDHLILVDRSGVRRLPVGDVPLRFGADLVADLSRRTEHAISQAHVLAVCRLALAAQAAGVAKGMTARAAGV